MEAPRVCILKTDGINCDSETAEAFKIAGGEPHIVHINDLRSGEESLVKYRILAIPGGFSYGDDIASGRVLANELTSYLGAEVNDFANIPANLVIGICNGFQTLAHTGLFSQGSETPIKLTLLHNTSGNFECRPTTVAVEKTGACIFLSDMDDRITLPVAHGEGRFFTDPVTMKLLQENRQVAFRYVDEQGHPTTVYPANPNGALEAIAGITDRSGRILGLMPHPERAVIRTQHPNWRRLGPQYQPQGLPLFQRMVAYVKEA